MALLYLDVTKSRKQRHHSGLRRLRMGLQRGLLEVPGLTVRECRWSYVRCGYVEVAGGRKITGPGTLFLTPEVFALRERPLSGAWLARYRGASATIYYDAIPFTHPEVTWPKSVRRFEPWFRGLPRYDKVFYISSSAMQEACELAKQRGVRLPQGAVIPLGADYQARPVSRESLRGRGGKPLLLSTGIVEPRKGYPELLQAAEALWAGGADFKLVILGRVNPWYGKPIAMEINRLRQRGRDLVHEWEADDDRLAHWHARASLVVQPSHAEGFGLPVLEALWSGCPVLCSRQPCVERVPEEKGLSVLPEVTVEALRGALGRLLQNPSLIDELEAAVPSNAIPVWREAAETLYRAFGEGHRASSS